MAGNLQQKPQHQKQQQRQHHRQHKRLVHETSPQKEYIQLNNNFTGLTTLRTADAVTGTDTDSTLYAKPQHAANRQSSYAYSKAPTTPTTGSSISSRANSSPLFSSQSSSTTTLTYKSLLATMGSCLGRCVSKETSHIVVKPTSCWRRQATDEQEADLMSTQSENNKRNGFIYRIMKLKSKKKSPQFIEKFWEHKDANYHKLNNEKSKTSSTDIQLQNLDVHNLLSKSSFAKESALNFAAHTSSSRASSSLDLEWEHDYTHIRQFIQQQQQQQLQLQQQFEQQVETSVRIHQPLQQHTTNDNLLTYQNDITWPYHTPDQTVHNTYTTPPCPPTSTALTRQSLGTEALIPPTPRATIKQVVNNLRRSSLSRNNSTHNSWSHISTPESLEWDVDDEQQNQLHTEDDNLDHETLKLLHQIEQLKNQVLHETGDGLVDTSTTILRTTTANTTATADDSIHYKPTSTLNQHCGSGEIVNFS